MVEHSHKTASHFYTMGFHAEEQPSTPRTRAVIGAVYGLWLGLIYALTAGVIDALVMRDVPIQVDWGSVGVALLTTGLGLAVLGVVTGWPTNKWHGILLGAAVYIGWLMMQSFIKLQGLATVFLVLFLPLVVMSLPITAVLRWVIERHLRNRHLPGLQRWRAQMISLVIVLGLGAFAGSWSQMPPAAQQAVRTVNRLVQRALTQSTQAQWPRAFDAVPDLRNHAGVNFKLLQRPSTASPTGVDVVVMFDDGYAMTCLVETTTSLTECVAGVESVFGPFEFDPNDQR